MDNFCLIEKDNETRKELFTMFKTQNVSERIKLSRQLEKTFISLYDPEKKLSPLNKLRTTRGIMNRMIHVIKYFIEVVRNNSILSSIVPSYHEDELKFIDALFEALRKTNIKLAFTPSKVPPKEYDNMDVLYYHGRDIEKEDPMIVENADDYIYTPTLNSENKDPLPSTKKQTTRKPDEDMLTSIIHHALRCKDIKKEYTNSEDDMYGLNADDKMYGLNADDKVDPIKLDEDWVSNVKEYLKDKERKVSHPDEDLLIKITKLIFEWCETANIDPSSAKYHILAELYSMMRRFVMLKKPEKEKEEEN